jgi:hypothetical protein
LPDCPSFRRSRGGLLGPRSWTNLTGDFRQKEHSRPDRPANYAYGLLRLPTPRSSSALSAVTACEFGVATGRGLTNMADVAAMVTEATGIRFRVVGFDTGAGLLPPGGHKDHPELWSGGDFAMQDPAELRRRLDGKAELILGDIAETIDPFVQTLTPECPLGFVSIDVDVYSATVSALKGLSGPHDRYLPAVSFYFDDILFYFANEACGELAAISEHNAAHPLRPVHPDRSLPAGARQLCALVSRDVCRALPRSSLSQCAPRAQDAVARRSPRLRRRPALARMTAAPHRLPGSLHE